MTYYTTETGAAVLGLRPSRLYDYAEAKYVEPPRAGVVMQWRPRDLAIVALIAQAIDKGCPYWLAHEIAARLNAVPGDAIDTIYDRAADLLIVHARNRWQLLDLALDAQAAKMARRAERLIRLHRKETR